MYNVQTDTGIHSWFISLTWISNRNGLLFIKMLIMNDIMFKQFHDHTKVAWIYIVLKKEGRKVRIADKQVIVVSVLSSQY